ncbi:MAG TPA: flavin reductase family protein [Nitrosopumilaceae archaeon]|nr:flavin reductase family protein [Nitrosopumilaceae archaeon]
MNLRIAEKAQRYFTTGISLVTSSGPHGQNVMAAEWTMQISYKPLLIAVFIHENSATFENIKKTKEFGINVSSEGQTMAVNIAGGYSRREIDKLKVKNSFEFLASKKIKSPMIAGCLINAECKLVTMKKLGDHTMVVGKAVAISYDETKKPLIYHSGRYFRIGSIIEPFRKIVNVDDDIFNWFSTSAKGKFVLKCVGLIIKSNNRILVLKQTKNTPYLTIPFVVPKRGIEYSKALDSYLKKSGLSTTTNNVPILKRITLKNKKRIQRINFVLFEGKLKPGIKNHTWQSPKLNSLLHVLSS